jgi:Major Facilitator Superfamily
VGSNILAFLGRGSSALVILLAHTSTWALATGAGVGSTAMAFFLPATQAIVPELVSANELPQANALIGLSRNGTQVLGAALGGIAVASIGPGWALAWDSCTYLASAMLLVRTDYGRPMMVGSRSSIWHDLAEGWQEFASRRWLWAVVGQFSLVNAAFGIGFQLLGPVIARAQLGGAAAWGFVLASLAAGYVLGGLVALRLRPERPLLVGLLAIFGLCLPLACLFLGLPLLALAGAALVAGSGLEIFGVAWSSVMQSQVPLAALSRVSSYDMLGSFALAPLAYALGGPLSTALGIKPTIGLCTLAVGVITLAVLALSDVRGLRSGPPIGPPSGPVAAP